MELVGQLRHKKFLVSSMKTFQGNDIKLKGGVTTDFPATGGKVMPAGAVVVKKTSDGLYYLASDAANGDRNAGAIVTSLEKPDADWKDKTLTWTINYPDGTVETGTVLGANGDDTIAEWVTVLNADERFSDHFVASDAGASDLLVITSRAAGNGITARMSMDLDTAFATDDGATSHADGTSVDADYRVVYEQRSLVDAAGASRNSDPVPTLLAGHFDESELTGLTLEAKAVLLGRDSFFE